VAPSDDNGEAATMIEAALHQIFEQTIFPQLKRAVELAEAATARVEAAEARCARIEQVIQQRSTRLSEHELKRLEEMTSRSLDSLKPIVDRTVKMVEEIARKNTLLAQACVALHDENVHLKSASIASIGKPS